MNIVWGYEYPGDARTVDVHIRRLREKIEVNPSDPKYVYTKVGSWLLFQGLKFFVPKIHKKSASAGNGDPERICHIIQCDPDECDSAKAMIREPYPCAQQRFKTSVRF